jgi:hypothetical protein
MSKKVLGKAAEGGIENEQHEPASISRRGLLKKCVYQAPTLVVLGTLGSMRKAAAESFPSEPTGSSGPPKSKNKPPERRD